MPLGPPRSSDARSLDRREVSRRSESEMHTLETLEYRAPLAALLPTVHASVPYFFDLLTFRRYSNLLYVPPVEPRGPRRGQRPHRDVGRCAFPTTVQATPTADHGTRAETSAAASRPRQPASGGAWLMAHGSWGSRCSYRDRCSYSGRCRLAAAEDCADSAEGGT